MEKDLGINFSPESTKKLFPQVHKVENWSDLDNIISIGDAEEVEPGDILPSQTNEYIVVSSYGANPCISGMVQTIDQKIYLFHSLGNGLTSEQKEIMTKCKKGIVGGGRKTLREFSSYFKEHNIKTIEPPGPEYYFNFALVKSKNEFKIPPGFYYSYEDKTIEQFQL